ncbi:CRISPR-associated endonuclease Cas1 [Methylocaldum sp. MU1018]
MRPLYLQGSGTAVRRDGPALRVARPGAAERWFPLRRISQVVSAGCIDWSVDALLACAENGITVSFIDHDGAVTARLVGKPGECRELRQRLLDFLLRPDWRDLYAQWAEAMERMAVRSVIGRTGLDFDRPPSAKDLRRLFREGAQSMDQLSAYDRIGREIFGLLTSLVTKHLADAGIAAECESMEDLDPVTSLSSILFWDFRLARLAWLEDRLRENRLGIPDRLEIVGFFEARRERTESLARGLLNRLHRWLIEIA